MAESAPSALAVAIRRQQWELAALCLLVGLAEVAERLPADSLSSLLAMLEEGGRPERRRRGCDAL